MDTLDFVSECAMVVRVGRRSDLILTGAYAGTDGCVVTQIPLDVRGYHMSVNTISGDKPLACDLPGSHVMEWKVQDGTPQGRAYESCCGCVS